MAFMLGPVSEHSIRHFFPLRVYRSCGACEQLRQPGPGECFGCGVDDGAHTRFTDTDDEAERLVDLASDFALRSFLFRQSPQLLTTDDPTAGPLAALTDGDIEEASVMLVDVAPNSGSGSQAANERDASGPGLSETQTMPAENGPAALADSAETTVARDVAPNRTTIDVDAIIQILGLQANRQDLNGLTFDIDAINRAVAQHANSPDIPLPSDVSLQAVANVQFSLLYCIIFNGLADIESGLIQRLGEPARAEMIGLLGRAILVFGDARAVIASWQGRRRDRPGWPGGYAGEDEQRQTRDDLLQWSRGQSPQTRADAEDFWSDFDQLGLGILRGGFRARPTAGGLASRLVTTEALLSTGTGPVTEDGNVGDSCGGSRPRVLFPALSLGPLEVPFLNFLCDGLEDWHVRRRVHRLATPWRGMLLSMFQRGSQLFQEATDSLQWWRDTRRPGLLSTEMSAPDEHVDGMMNRVTLWAESHGLLGAAEFWLDLRELAASLQREGPAALLEEWQEEFLNRHRGGRPRRPGGGDTGSRGDARARRGAMLCLLWAPKANFVKSVYPYVWTCTSPWLLAETLSQPRCQHRVPWMPAGLPPLL